MRLFLPCFVLHVFAHVHAIPVSDVLVSRISKLDSQCVVFDSLGWWKYNICFNETISQFHQEKHALASSQVISLGTVDRQSPPKLLKAAAKQSPEASFRQYLRVLFTNGAICDDSQTRRATELRFFCCHSKPRGRRKGRMTIGNTFIRDVSEIRTCSYLVTVCTSLMCPDYREEDLHVEDPPSSEHDPPLGGEHDLADNHKHQIDDAANHDTTPPPEEPKPVLSLLTDLQVDELRKRVKSMFYHGYNAYLEHAFPLDQLRPMSCDGESFELTAGSMLTLIDTLDTLVVMGEKEDFHHGVRLVIGEITNYNIDENVSVFETTIRIVGGLLSAHIYATDTDFGFHMDDYDGELLALAVDLADRLLPAFETSTSIPYGTVHLQNGVPTGETTEACTAAAGSLSLELGVLSVLTGDPKYAIAARDSLKAIYDLRSKLNLLGRHIDTNTGKWTETAAGIGSNIDSIYEYYVKQYILFGDDQSFHMFTDLYYGAMDALWVNNRWYVEAEMHKGSITRTLFNSLQCFWPGMQSIVGDLHAATRTLNGFYQIWNDFDFTPEDFSIDSWRLIKGGMKASYPLRPELIESTYHLHVATGDPSWLVAGRDMLVSLERHSKTECGYATIRDVGKKSLEDQMPSFFLSEVCKYLYLLFDQSNPFRPDNGGEFVFTTEAHPFPLRTGKFDMHDAAAKLGFFGKVSPKRKSKASNKKSLQDQKRAKRAGRRVKAGVFPTQIPVDYMLSSLHPSIDGDQCYAEDKYEPYYGARVHKKRFRPLQLDNEEMLKLEIETKKSAGEKAAPSHPEPAQGLSFKPFGDGSKSKEIKPQQAKKKPPPEENDQSILFGADSVGERLDAGPELGQFKLLTSPYGGFEVQHVQSGVVATFENVGASISFLTIIKPPTSAQSMGGATSDVEGVCETQVRDDGTMDDVCSAGSRGGGKDSLLEEEVPNEVRSIAATTYFVQQGDPTGYSTNGRHEVDGKAVQSFQFGFATFGPKIKDLPSMGLGEPSALVLPDIADGCTEEAFRGLDCTDKIVVVARGTCMFEEKVLLAQAAGAKAVVVGLVEEGPVFVMAGMNEESERGLSDTTIPAFMVDVDTYKQFLRNKAHNQQLGLDIVPTSKNQVPIILGTQRQIVALVDEKWGIIAKQAAKVSSWQLSIVSSEQVRAQLGAEKPKAPPKKTTPHKDETNTVKPLMTSKDAIEVLGMLLQAAATKGNLDAVDMLPLLEKLSGDGNEEMMRRLEPLLLKHLESEKDMDSCPVIANDDSANILDMLLNLGVRGDEDDDT